MEKFFALRTVSMWNIFYLMMLLDVKNSRLFSPKLQNINLIKFLKEHAGIRI